MSTKPKDDQGQDSELLRDRYRGALLGLAAGDALGTTIEFRSPGSFEPIDDIVGGGPFNLSPGHWTDDTSMALCLAASLIERCGFDAHDQVARYLRWLGDGYMSSTGACFDVGTTVRTALALTQQTGDPFSGPTHSYSAGNGSIMRLAPVPLFYANEPGLAIDMAAQSSRTTHGAAEAVDACRYLAGVIVGAVLGRHKTELLSPGFSPVPGLWESQPLSPAIAAVAAGSFKVKDPPEIKGTGYVVKSLEAALWAFDRGDSFRDGALLAVNLGDDADTTGAVYGQLAGAFYGESGLPGAWVAKLAMVDTLRMLADGLLAAAQKEEG